VIDDRAQRPMLTGCCRAPAADVRAAVFLTTPRRWKTMTIRYLKILLVAFVGLQGFLYVAGNIANWSAGVGAIGYVLGMQEHTVYATHIFPPLTGTAWATLAFLVILAGEFLVGALSFKGALDLWNARNADAGAFNAAKTWAILGAGMSMVVWFGLFVVVGGALFQMWQTKVGSGSFHDAFIFAASGGLVLLIVNAPDR
jgi:predicted small integral membrane protein